jgi:RNA polymerase sigma-70 factor, ECF subfamily
VNEAERDEDLVRRYLQGDAQAFAVLVERHERRVYNVALRVLGNAEDARDATQDAFLAALRKLEQFRGEAAFTTWLHRITVNACYDVLRKQRRQPMLRLAQEGDERTPEPGPPAPDHSDETAGTIDAARALREIPDEYRIAVVLADVQDLPYEEIARVLDVPVGTVKSRVHRGRLALARAMGLEGSPTTYRAPGDPREPAATTEPSEKES